jgi:hypothetical protein
MAPLLLVGDLEIAAETPGDAVRLRWAGKSNDRQPAKTVGPYLHTALNEAARSGGALELCFESLQHLNSSTIALIVELVQRARQKGVRLALVYDPRVRWQKLSFEALRVFAKDGLLELRPT